MEIILRELLRLSIRVTRFCFVAASAGAPPLIDLNNEMGRRVRTRHYSNVIWSRLPRKGTRHTHRDDLYTKLRYTILLAPYLLLSVPLSVRLATCVPVNQCLRVFTSIGYTYLLYTTILCHPQDKKRDKKIKGKGMLPPQNREHVLILYTDYVIHTHTHTRARPHNAFNTYVNVRVSDTCCTCRD